METVNDFVNTFKTCIMANFSSDESCSIHEKHAQLITEINGSEKSLEDKERCLQKVESAFKIIKQDLIGWEENE